jgi:hypothetical protein
MGERGVIRVREWETRHEHGVSARGRGNDRRYNFLHAAVALVRLRAKLKPTVRHAQNGACGFILGAALPGGFALRRKT